MATYVVSDLHGQYTILEKLLKKAAFGDGDKLYVLGDAIDRGPDGIKILLLVKDTPNMELLLGNHEFMMLNSVAPDGSACRNYHELPGDRSDSWIFRNGGNKTYYKYKLLKKDERIELLEWLNNRSLSTLVEVNNIPYLLTHTYFKKDMIDVPYKDIEYQTVWDIVWKSPFRFDLFVPESDYSKCFPWMFIVGHVPVCTIPLKEGEKIHRLEPFMTTNIINIDGCCAHHTRSNSAYRGGILLRLDDLAKFTCSFEEIQ